jgi:hypothetical protein
MEPPTVVVLVVPALALGLALAIAGPASAQPATATPDVAGPASVQPATAAPDAVTWRYDKGLTATTADDRFELGLGVRSQLRFEVTRPEAKDEFEDRFAVGRVRLQLEGFAFGEANAYKLEYDVANKGFSVLKDFYLEHAFTPAVRLRAGQWKKPFSRQELTSDFAQAFNERALIGEVAGAGRDLGVALHSGYERSPDGAEWAVGVFNGTGDKPSPTFSCTDPTDTATCTVGPPTNVPTDFVPEAVARVGWNHGGIKGYSELDLEGGPLRVAVGAAYKLRMGDFVDSSLLVHAAELDGIVKLEGLDVTGGLFLVKRGEEDAELGGYAQAGYLVVPDRLALSGRFGSVPLEDSDRNRLELLGALDLLAHGHAYKLVLDGGVLHDTATKADDVVARAQAQLVF